MKTLIKLSTIAVLLVGMYACGGKISPSSETPTSGNIKIGVDESYQLMINAQIELFEAIYNYALINPKYESEVTAFSDLLNDSVRLIIVNRKLTDEEDKFLRSKQIIPKTTKIALDGLAFIISKENKDTVLRYDQVRDIFLGKITTWNQIDPKANADTIKVIFDSNESGNPRFIREKFNITSQFPSNCFAVNNNEEVVNYVEKNPDALGIISVNWISDRDDTTSNRFMKAIKVVGIGDEADTEGIGPFVKPFQGYLAEGSYPFIRDVYVINRESFSGLGTGFASFVAGEKGQRLILKSGMVPATMPIRLIQVNNQ